MRTTKELLTLLRDEIENDTYSWHLSKFMCSLSLLKYKCKEITFEENKKIQKFLKSKKPKKLDIYGGWYPPSEREQRIKWLNNEINKL